MVLFLSIYLLKFLNILYHTHIPKVNEKQVKFCSTL
nr:MAG TPA: hypothetical protein [Caudoviricetes sp.]